MSNAARIGVVVATVAVLVVAFILLSPEADDDSNTAQTPTATAPATTTTGPATRVTPPPSADHEPAPQPAPTFERVRVRGGKPVGGIQKITVKKGERARIEVTSTDTSDEIHLHGYDITRDLKPGRRARFSFKANAEGIFEIELHGSGTLIANLTVEP
jgi:FtsP/CotA-like multicopper oxidase with cupredoxin domain